MDFQLWKLENLFLVCTLGNSLKIYGRLGSGVQIFPWALWARENNIQNMPSVYCRRKGWTFVLWLVAWATIGNPVVTEEPTLSPQCACLHVPKSQNSPLSCISSCGSGWLHISGLYQSSWELQILDLPFSVLISYVLIPSLYQHPLVCLPGFVLLILDFGMLGFMRSIIDLCKEDKTRCVKIRSHPRWLGSQKMHKSYKSKLEYFLVTWKSSYLSKMDFTFGAKIKLIFP